MAILFLILAVLTRSMIGQKKRRFETRRNSPEIVYVVLCQSWKTVSLMGTSAERTEVLEGLENIIPALVKFYSSAVTRLDIMVLFDDIRNSVERRPLLEAYLNLWNRRVNVRAITKISKDNLGYLRYLKEELISDIEFRHLSDLRGAFAVTDTEYVVSPSAERLSVGNNQAVFCDARALVKHHQLLFDTLWTIAKPMQLRVWELRRRTPEQLLDDAFVVLKLIGEQKVSPFTIYSTSGLSRADAEAAIAYLLHERLVASTSDGFSVLLQGTQEGLELSKQK